MRSLHIFHGSNLLNGVDRTTITLIKGLRDAGVQAIAVVPAAGAVTDALDQLGVDWTCMPAYCCLSAAWRAELRYLAASSERTRLIVNILEEHGCDIVHINTGHLFDAALASATAGVPAIWHIHAPFEIDYERYKRFLTPNGYAWMLETLGSRTIAVSDDVANSLRQYLPAETVRVVYNGIDVQDLHSRAMHGSGSIRNELGLPGDCKLVLGVGRVSAQKDFATFVKVAAVVAKAEPTTYFAIAGPPEDRALYGALTSDIEHLGLEGRVLLLGPRSDVPRLMHESDLFLSTAIFEGHPLVALEAMALSCPVVAMACVGLRECISDREGGRLVALGDTDAAASAVVEVLRDRSLAEKLRQGGLRMVSNEFSSRTYAETFLDVAREAVEAGPSSIAPGALDFVGGLLQQLRSATDRIDELARPAGWLQRIGGRLDRIFVRSPRE